jgi:hypothetical protein
MASGILLALEIGSHSMLYLLTLARVWLGERRNADISAAVLLTPTVLRW